VSSVYANVENNYIMNERKRQADTAVFFICKFESIIDAKESYLVSVLIRWYILERYLMLSTDMNNPLSHVNEGMIARVEGFSI